MNNIKIRIEGLSGLPLARQVPWDGKVDERLRITREGTRHHKTTSFRICSNQISSTYSCLYFSQYLSVCHISSFLSMWVVGFWFHFGFILVVTWRSLTGHRSQVFCRVFFGFGRSRPPGRRSAPARAAATGIGKNIEKIIKYVLSKTYAKKHRQTANHMKSLDMFWICLDEGWQVWYKHALSYKSYTYNLITGLRWIGRPGACGVGRVGRVGQEKRRREEELQREEERRREEPGTSLWAPQRSTYLNQSQPISTNLPFKVVKVVKLSDFEFGYF